MSISHLNTRGEGKKLITSHHAACDNVSSLLALTGEIDRRRVISQKVREARTGSYWLVQRSDIANCRRHRL